MCNKMYENVKSLDYTKKFLQSDSDPATMEIILPEHHALCLNTPAFSLQFIVPAQSHIKRRVVNRSIVRLFHR